MRSRWRWHERTTIDGIELRPIDAQLVGILREQPGQAVSREELIRRLWPEVTDYPPAHAIAHLRELVYRVREAWRDETGTDPIATQYREGYVWRADD